MNLFNANQLNRILFNLLGLTVLFLLQQYRVLSIAGINPNLLLIGFLVIIFFQEQPIWLFIITSFLFLVIIFWFFNFWFLPILILTLLVIIMDFFKNLLTANKFIDFNLAFLIMSGLFYSLLFIFGVSFKLMPWVIFQELIYSIILGIIVIKFGYLKYEKR